MTTLLLFGRAGPRSLILVEQILDELEPDRLVTLAGTGLVRYVRELAEDRGIPLERYWIERLAFKGRPEGLQVAVHKLVALEHPLIPICIRPRKHDHRTIRLLNEVGQSVIVGHIDKARQISWDRVPAYSTPRSSDSDTGM